MQSTGVYWIPLYDILEEFGFEVFLVNARHTKNLPGRKSDVQESQWLLKLAHLRSIEQLVSTSIRYSRIANLLASACGACGGDGDMHSTHAKGADPDEHTIGKRNQRSEWTDRTSDRASHSDGERDPQKLAELIDCRIRATKQEVAKSLEGNWRPELLFVLQQQVEMYEIYQRRIAECDEQLQEHLASFCKCPIDTVDEGHILAQSKNRRADSRYMPQFPLSNELMRIIRSGPDANRWR